MFMERWGPAAGCGDCGLVDSGSEGAEKNRGREEVPYRYCTGEEGMKEDSVLGLFWYSGCFHLVLGSEWRKKLSGLMSTRPLLIL